MADSIIDLAQKFRDALLREDEATMNRLATAYNQIYVRLKDKLQLLIDQIEKQEGDMTASQIIRLTQYRDLMNAVQNELAKYGTYVEMELSQAARRAIDLAVNDTRAYLQSMGYDTPQQLPTAAIESMLGFLQEDGELYKRLGMLAPTHAADLADKLVEGIALGYNPTKIAKLFERVMGGGLTDALRMTRTAQLYAYREATRANYIANDDVVQGWIWWAELDNDTCMGCIAEHGTIHPLDETLNDHHNGRCAMLPYLGDNTPDKNGQDWFMGLSEAKQKEIMGFEKWQAWKDGKFEFSQLSAEHQDDVYGTMRGAANLKDLLGE
jgi:hypothetical protein